MKQTLVTIALLTLWTVMAAGQTSVSAEKTNIELTQLTVNLVDIKSDEGKISVALYDSAGNWLNSRYLGKISEIQNGVATVVFENVPYGDYAISAFHDKDENGKLKTGFFGIPTEPYASSRGAKARFGPPKWRDAVFTLSTTESEETIKF